MAKPAHSEIISFCIHGNDSHRLHVLEVKAGESIVMATGGRGEGGSGLGGGCCEGEKRTVHEKVHGVAMSLCLLWHSTHIQCTCICSNPCLIRGQNETTLSVISYCVLTLNSCAVVVMSCDVMLLCADTQLMCSRSDVM